MDGMSSSSLSRSLSSNRTISSQSLGPKELGGVGNNTPPFLLLFYCYCFQFYTSVQRIATLRVNVNLCEAGHHMQITIRLL